MKSFTIDRREYVETINRYKLKIDDNYVKAISKYILKRYVCPDNVVEFLKNMTVQDFYNVYNEEDDEVDEDILYGKVTVGQYNWTMCLFDVVKEIVSEDMWETPAYDTEYTDTLEVIDDIVDIVE